MGEKNYGRQSAALLMFLAVVTLFAILKTMASVVMPIVFAALLSFAMLPIARSLNRARVPWALAVVIVTLILIFTILVTGTLVGAGINTILSQYSKYESKFLSIYKYAADWLDIQFFEGQSFFYNIKQGLGAKVDLGGAVRRAILSTGENVITLARSVFVAILMFVFLLMEMRLTREKFSEAFEGGAKNRVANMARRIVSQVVRFLSIKFFISLATGLLVYGCAKIVRLDFAVVWGSLAFALNFIPTFGSIVSVSVTSLFALLQFFPRPGPVVAMFASTLAVNMTLGNIVEPRVEGDNLGISPFVILVMLSLWSWMWGFAGMILAVPLTVVIKICCENVPMLHPLAIILGNKPQDTKREMEAGAGDEKRC